MVYSDNSNLNLHAIDFVKTYKSLNIRRLDLDPYNLKYLNLYLGKLQYNTYLACELLYDFESIKNTKTIIDFGGGIGFNSAFFSLVGFEKVIYVDVDEKSLKDAQHINKHLGINNIEYITGDAKLLVDLDLSDCIICSRDVIEHIYNLKEFFKITSAAKFNRHNTAAIKNSIFRRKEFKRIHQNAEYEGNAGFVLKKRDDSRPYSELRKSIVVDLLSEGDSYNLNRIVKSTRGLDLNDIRQYLKSGIYPEHHIETLGSNTCNPYTGNWAERTLSFKEYKMFSDDLSLRLKLKLANYNTYNQPLSKKIMLQFLNFTLATLESERLAPSFTIMY